jgi:hypothetical protein
MFVERRKLATLLQPDEPDTVLTYWAWQLPVNTPAAKGTVRQEVMHGVLVPNMHFEA